MPNAGELKTINLAVSLGSCVAKRSMARHPMECPINATAFGVVLLVVDDDDDDGSALFDRPSDPVVAA
jgi:hypothetical protein